MAGSPDSYPRASLDPDVGDADVEPDFEGEPLAPVGINPGRGRLRQLAKESAGDRSSRGMLLDGPDVGEARSSRVSRLDL